MKYIYYVCMPMKATRAHLVTGTLSEEPLRPGRRPRPRVGLARLRRLCRRLRRSGRPNLLLLLLLLSLLRRPPLRRPLEHLVLALQLLDAVLRCLQLVEDVPLLRKQRAKCIRIFVSELEFVEKVLLRILRAATSNLAISPGRRTRPRRRSPSPTWGATPAWRRWSSSCA